MNTDNQSQNFNSQNALQAFGWSHEWQCYLNRLPTQKTPQAIARVCCAHRTRWDLATATGPISAEIAGHFHQRATIDRPVVGDWVLYNPLDNARAFIAEILPRKSLIKRIAAGKHNSDQAVAANIDTVFIVGGLDGDHEPRRLRRYVALVSGCGAKPVILLNKVDTILDPSAAIHELDGIQKDIPIHTISAKQGLGLKALNQYLMEGHTIALLGSSGVGKTTLLNYLINEDDFATGDIRHSDSKGRHTTTTRQLVPHPSGAIIMDTPGMRELALSDDASDIAASYHDITSIAVDCRFHDCTHNKEPGCAVRLAIEEGRIAEDALEDQQKLERETMIHSERKHERNARMKQFGRIIKDAKRKKGRW